MNISTNKNLIIRASSIIANGTYILFWIFWLLNGGFKFIGKIGVLLFSPPLLFNLHWGTQWVTDKVFYTLIILVTFLITSLLLWKLNVKVFGRTIAKQVVVGVISLIYILFFIWFVMSTWINFTNEFVIFFGERAMDMFYDFTIYNLILLGIFTLAGYPIYKLNKKVFKK